MVNTTEYINAYYIDQRSGSDDNLGTKNSPFKSIQKAVNVAAENNNDSNTIYLNGGIHYLDRSIEIDHQSGEQNSYLTIQSAPGQKAVIDGRGIENKRGLLEIKDSRYVRIEDLEIRNAPSHGIEVINGQHIDINDNLIHHTQAMGIRVRGYTDNSKYEGDTRIQSSNVTIEDNGVFLTNLSNSGANKNQSNWGAGIQAWNAKNITIANNTVGENYGEGIGLTLVDNGTVANNTLYDNFSVQVYLDNAVNSVVEENFIFNGRDSRFYRYDLPANGIAMANEIHNIADPQRFYLDDNRITRNVIVGANSGIVYGTWAGRHQNGASNNWQGMRDTNISHNTIYNPVYNALKFYPDSNKSNINISNNIFAQESNRDLTSIDDFTGLNFRSNLWYGNDPGNGYSVTDVFADPEFVRPGGFTITDYRLRPNSEAIDAINYSTDNDFVTDGEADLGALEFGQSVFTTGT